MSIVLRPVGYTGTLQRMVWALGSNVPVTAYLWGGGGGGGGNDSGAGGNGAGGSFATVNFAVNPGDVIDIAVGGGGGAGASGRGSAPGGAGGASFTPDIFFSTATATPSSGPGGAVVRQFNSNYCSFLNSTGVWIDPTTATTFDKTYTVSFPLTDTYQFIASADNYASIYIDGNLVLSPPWYGTTYETSVSVTAGTHSIRIVATNTGGPGAVGLTITAGDSFGGARGGSAGPSGSSGGGGGGGGGTVVLLNGTPIGAAGGGGGGGGGGNTGARIGQNAPGDRGNAPVGVNAGQNGEDKGGDGGGGGGGGGGWAGGNGGSLRDGDQGGLAGVNGFSSAPFTPSAGRTAGGTNSTYYPGPGVATGGSPTIAGAPGYAMFEFNLTGIFLYQDGVYTPVIKHYIKNNNAWQEVKATYVKDNNVWYPIYGSVSPGFNNVANSFGVRSRPYS
jgi:hypothetical protein